MNTSAFIESPVFSWVVLPLLIFIARVLDVSLGTVRIILISRGKKYLSPFLGFVEVMIWLLAIRQIIFNLSNWACYFAFAGGFAMGNFVGIYIEEKIAMGTQVIRIITRMEATDLIGSLQQKGYGVTVVDAMGTTGKVNVIFTIINRRDQDKVIELIKKFNPKAFYSVEDIRSVKEGVFPEYDKKF